MKKYLATTVAAFTMAVAAGCAQAADLKAPVYKASPMPVVEPFSPWMLRVRALGVITNDSGWVNTVAGSSLRTSDTAIPELDVSYFFTKNVAAELILGVTRHSVTGAGTIAGLPVGKAWLLPPTLTLQYHFTDFGAFKPYVGAGINYTWFFSESAGNQTVGGLTVTRSNLHNTFGLALQAGFDYMIDRHWGLNLDVKKLFLRPSWDGTINGAAFTGRANLDPWLVGGGLTYRF